jgi:hypothetical protein
MLKPDNVRLVLRAEKSIVLPKVLTLLHTAPTVPTMCCVTLSKADMCPMFFGVLKTQFLIWKQDFVLTCRRLLHQRQHQHQPSILDVQVLVRFLMPVIVGSIIFAGTPM